MLIVLVNCLRFITDTSGSSGAHFAQRGQRPCLTKKPMLHGYRFPILTPHLAQAIADLADSGECFNTIEYAGQNVLSTTRGFFQLDQRSFPSHRIATLAQSAQSFDLSFLNRRIDTESLD